MKKIITILLGVAFLLTAGFVGTGCCPCRKQKAAQTAQLVNKEWTMVKIGDSQRTFNANQYTIKIADDGSMTGVGDCNRLMGSVKFDASGAIRFENVASTRMACPDNESEYRFTAALDKASAYKVDGQMMMLLNNGEVLAVFECAK